MCLVSPHSDNQDVMLERISGGWGLARHCLCPHSHDAHTLTLHYNLFHPILGGACSTTYLKLRDQALPLCMRWMKVVFLWYLRPLSVHILCGHSKRYLLDLSHMGITVFPRFPRYPW